MVPFQFCVLHILHYSHSSLHLTSFGTSFGSFRLELQVCCVQVMNILRVATAMKESRRHRMAQISDDFCVAVMLRVDRTSVSRIKRTCGIMVRVRWPA